ncbi:hypothetical protein THASP1DRAFT_14820 [Thamnocephalis sphaerospora]|uniref:Peptide hydrolase n=1 Tax=Thamnocephalis sphaerospora TaxID=78915 RepID=A0A4P9XSA5_9FUNG|nr:hypothetical protein THASP1DRAFT_14820 [Thamnocephalis sphaerospora]|eukprot:RKP09014.1 hypothetical protein THASP1DRAFT_14820 [Thamnocephalis sphaerospora]
MRHYLPPARPVDADAPHVSGQAAWQHLEQLTLRPHPQNSRDNDRIRQYLIDELLRLRDQAVAMGRPAEFTNSTVLESMGMFYHDQNLILRLPGTQSNESILLSSHYDSVHTSYGAFDDGISVATMLETIRALIHRPQTRYGLTFLINNGEEMGLLGGKAFMQHPWAKDVRAFVNFEAGGAAGKPLIFQATGPQVIAPWAEAMAQTHGNVAGNDMFAMGLIPR